MKSWREILQLFPPYKVVWSLISVTEISIAKARRVHSGKEPYSCSHWTNTFGHSSQLQRSQVQRHEEFILARNSTVVLIVQSRLITHLIYKYIGCKGTKSSYWREILQFFTLYKVVWSLISITKSSVARHEEFILARNSTVVPTVQSRLITHLGYRDLNCKGTESSYWGKILQLFPLYTVVRSLISVTTISFAKPRRVHTGEKSYSWSHCKMSFSSYVIWGDIKKLELAGNHRSALFVQSPLSKLYFFFRDI
jgi:hypothetical protein